jgi:hypothetical protein
VDIALEQQIEEPKENSVREQRTWQLVGSDGPNWFLLHQSLQNALIRQPGVVRVLFRTDDTNEEVCIGTCSAL